MDQNHVRPNPTLTSNDDQIDGELFSFLKKLNLEEHYRGLKEEDVDMPTLFLCKTHDDLEALGITKAGQRMRLLKAMKPECSSLALSTPSISALATPAHPTPARSASTLLTSAPITSAPTASAPLTSSVPSATAPTSPAPIKIKPPSLNIPALSNHGDTQSSQTESTPLVAPITSAPTPSKSTLVTSANEPITSKPSATTPITSEPAAVEALVIIAPPNYGQPNTPPPAYGEVGKNFPGELILILHIFLLLTFYTFHK